MARADTPERTAEAGSLWLEARLGESTWVFELAPTEDRAIIVGSLPRSHIRIDREGVFSVHFHFEREGASVRLVPGYRGDLFVDGVPVSRPKPLEDAAVIDFSGTQLLVRVLADASDLAPEAIEARSWDDQRAREAEEANEWLSELTVAAIPSPASLDSSTETRAVAPFCDVHVAKIHRPLPLPPWPSTVAAYGHGGALRGPRDPEFLPTPVAGSAPTKAWGQVPARANSNDNAIPRPTSTEGLNSQSRGAVTSARLPPRILSRVGASVRRRPVLASLLATGSTGMLVLALFAAWQTVRVPRGAQVVTHDFAATPDASTHAEPITLVPAPTSVRDAPTSIPQTDDEVRNHRIDLPRTSASSHPRKTSKSNAQLKAAH